MYVCMHVQYIGSCVCAYVCMYVCMCIRSYCTYVHTFKCIFLLKFLCCDIITVTLYDCSTYVCVMGSLQFVLNPHICRLLYIVN